MLSDSIMEVKTEMYTTASAAVRPLLVHDYSKIFDFTH